MEMTPSQFQKVLRQVSVTGVAALDRVPGRRALGSAHVGESLPDNNLGPLAMFEVQETKEGLIHAINEMGDREKMVITLYYYEGLTLAEIGEILGVTESRVSQIHTKSVLQLGAKLADRRDGDGPKRGGAETRAGVPARAVDRRRRR